MDDYISASPHNEPRQHRGIWHAQPQSDGSFRNPPLLGQPSPSSETADPSFLGWRENEIRSRVSIRKNGRLSPENAHEVVGEAVLRALDTEPLWSNHLLTKRRPNIEEISWTLADAFEWMDDHLILPFEDLVVVIRFRSKYLLETCAIVTVEPIYAGGEVCYWLRCSLYEGSENTSHLVGFLRSMVSFYEALDYPDANLLDSLRYSFVSKTPIAAYAAHPARTQTLFLIPKSATDTRARKVLRLMMAGALLPYGVVGELSSDGIRDLTGIKLPKDVCAIALPPAGLASAEARIVLEAPNPKDADKLIWAGMAEYLHEIVQHDPPWLSDLYEMRPAREAAVQYARLIPNRSSCVVRPYRLDKALADHIRATTEQPGWDLYSPLPIEEEKEPTAIGGAVETDATNAEAVAEAAPSALVCDERATEESEGHVDTGYPSSLAELPSWVERRLDSALEIAPRAIREMKKFRHPHPERIAQALELLAGPRLATFRGDRGSARAFHQGLATLRLRDGFSGAERLAGRTGSDYLLSHQGKTFLLDRHLASNSSGFNDPKMIRIYYFYDPGSDKIVVGWLPTHLQTSKS